MADHDASLDIERVFAAQYAGMLRASLLSDWLHNDQEKALLRRATLSRYVDLVRAGQAEDARKLLAWHDAELARQRALRPRAA